MLRSGELLGAAQAVVDGIRGSEDLGVSLDRITGWLTRA